MRKYILKIRIIIKVKKEVVFSLLMLSLFSCKKFGPSSVEGNIYETGSNTPISGVKVYIGKWKRNSTHDTYVYTLIDNMITDNNGKYKFLFNKELKYRYSVWFRDTTHYRGLDSKELENKATVKNFSLDPFSYIKVKIKKNSLGVWKHININLNLENVDKVERYNQLDTTLPTIYKLKGNNSNFIYWFVTTTPPLPAWEISTYYEEHIYLSKGDTITKTFIID